MNKMNNILDDVAIIDNLTVNNLASVSFADMLTILGPFVLVDIPEDTSQVDMKKRVDFLLARTANLHAYLTFLAVHASHQRAILKGKQPDAAEDMLKKKEALYELASAVKLKYEAVSRKITLAVQEEGDPEVRDRPNYSARAAAPSANWTANATPAPSSTPTPRTPTPSPYDAGAANKGAAAVQRSRGWNNVG